MRPINKDEAEGKLGSAQPDSDPFDAVAGTAAAAVTPEADDSNAEHLT